MKKILFLLLITLTVVSLQACNRETAETPEVLTALDGRYRGIYEDGGEQQVSIQFTVTDNTISNVSFRWLMYRGVNYRTIDDSHPQWGVKLQHDQIADFLEGQPLSAISDLHSPGEFIDDVDGWSGASIRGNKVYSAMRDALNRGLYTPAADADYNIDLGSLPDGRYRGIYGDGGEQQVSIQFTLTDNIISNVSFRWLMYRGINYRTIDETHPQWGVKLQHDQIAAELAGKNINDITALHSPGDLADDVDGWSGATIRGNKIYSAMRDAINRGLYTPADENYTVSFDALPNGRYRGIYGDGGEQQVSLQFTLTDNIISNVSFRWLMYRGLNYRTLESDHPQWGVKLQHDQIISYFEGRNINDIIALHNPGEFIDDVDGWSGATIRGNKIYSAFRDAINRHPYIPAD